MSKYVLGDANRFSRRRFLESAAALGATAMWAGPSLGRSRTVWCERRDLYLEGVASGDPDTHSVLLWTRRVFEGASRGSLQIEVAEDAAFSRIVASMSTEVSAAADWTCRVLVGNLRPASIYWYRFTDARGYGSRIGRTRTAPSDDDPRPVKFAFVSCQNVNLGWQHAYRRMIFEDDQAPEDERLGFVLHLGDFIYEVVWYSEDRPEGVQQRRVRDIVRYEHGEKIEDFHIPTTVEDYRAAYRAYLHDPDIQDARARWPFVAIWDNHEFSRNGWQSLQVFEGRTRPAQTRKVAANQAWFEYQPARIAKSSGPSLFRFDPPPVKNMPIDRFDQHGLGLEPNNLAALDSLTGYRALRWGRHIELIITDQRSYRSELTTYLPEAEALWSPQFPGLIPQEVLEILDAGRTYDHGRPPVSFRVGSLEIPNPRKDLPPATILGAPQEEWFLRRLKASTATWKIWGCTTGTLDMRVDPQNLPPGGQMSSWPSAGYASFGDGDHGSAYIERARIYNFVRSEKITGFVTVAGDRHSFSAGLAAPTLPPKPFEPVGVAFITGSISTPSSADYLSDIVPPDHPFRPLYFVRRTHDAAPELLANMLLRHGVRACLEFERTFDAERARRLSNPELAPHLRFLDLGGHGFATVRAASDALECEFVCIPRPAEQVTRSDGGAVIYRVVHRTSLWDALGTPHLEQRVVEGNPQLSL